MFLFVLVTCRCQFELYLLSFSSTGFAFNLFILFVVKKVAPGCASKKFNLDWWQSFLSPFLLRPQISLPYKRMGRSSWLYTFVPENFWTKIGLKIMFRVPSIWEIYAYFFVECPVHFRRKFQNWNAWLVNICYPLRFYILLGLVLKIPPSRIILWYFHSTVFSPPCFVMWILLSVNYRLDRLLCLDGLHKLECLFLYDWWQSNAFLCKSGFILLLFHSCQCWIVWAIKGSLVWLRD
jgi:hypothetical protein